MKTMLMLVMGMVLVATAWAQPTVKFTYLTGADELIMTVDLDGKMLSQVVDGSCTQLAEGKTPEGWGLEYYLEFGEKGKMTDDRSTAVYFCIEIGKPVPNQVNTVKLTGAGINGLKQAVDIYLSGTNCRVTPFAIFDGKTCFLSSASIWATLNGEKIANSRNNYQLILPMPTPTTP